MKGNSSCHIPNKSYRDNYDDIFKKKYVFSRCKIIATTKRLKQVIKEFGNEWFAISAISKMQCFDNALGVKIKSDCGQHVRNVRYPSQILFLEDCL